MEIGRYGETPLDPNTLAYAIDTGRGVIALAHDFEQTNKGLETETKPDGSSRTGLDDEIDDLVHERHADGVMQSEEREHEITRVPDGTPVTHADPLDGTDNYRRAAELKRTSGQNGLPESGAAFSMGIIEAGKSEAERGVLAFPFLPNGSRLYAVEKGDQPTCEDNGGDVRILRPPIIDPSKQKVVILSKGSSEKYSAALAVVGIGVVEYDAAVAAGMAGFDPSLAEELLPPDLVENKVVVGTIMRGGKNWDVAGLQGFADALGGRITNLHGQPRTYEPGEKGAIVAVNQAIWSSLLQAVENVA